MSERAEYPKRPHSAGTNLRRVWHSLIPRPRTPLVSLLIVLGIAQDEQQGAKLIQQGYVYLHGWRVDEPSLSVARGDYVEIVIGQMVSGALRGDLYALTA